jgi:hypothetical protein
MTLRVMPAVTRKAATIPMPVTKTKPAKHISKLSLLPPYLKEELDADYVTCEMCEKWAMGC